MVNSHAIIGFDANGPKGGTIKYTDPLAGGYDEMSVDYFLKNFNAITYGKKPGRSISARRQNH